MTGLSTMTKPVRLGITGWKNSGKTTLLAALAKELIARGYVVSTVKHAHHTFDIDHEGTDSYKHRQSGAQQTALVSSKRWAIMRETPQGNEPDLNSVIIKLDPCDLVLIEGYKLESHPKIEAVNPKGSDRDPLYLTDNTVIALVCRSEVAQCTLPQFDASTENHIAELADFVETHFMLAKAS